MQKQTKTAQTSNQLEKRASISSFFAGAILTVLCIIITFYCAFTNVELFQRSLIDTVNHASLGIDEQVVKDFATETIQYLSGEKVAWEPSIIMSGMEASKFIPLSFYDHMATVKWWLVISKVVCGVLSILLIVCIIRAFFIGKTPKFHSIGYYLGVGLPVILVVGIGLFAWLDFDLFWKLLHEWLIPDGIFSATELVMQLFPVEVFQAYLPVVGFWLLGLIMAVIFLPSLLIPIATTFRKLRK